RKSSHAAWGMVVDGMGVGSPRGSGGNDMGSGGTGVTGASLRRGNARVGRFSMSSMLVSAGRGVGFSTGVGVGTGTGDWGDGAAPREGSGAEGRGSAATESRASSISSALAKRRSRSF